MGLIFASVENSLIYRRYALVGTTVSRKGKRANRQPSNISGTVHVPDTGLTQNTLTGRLVWNHSTHIPGLINILKRLIKIDGIGTVTPAVISHGRSNSHQFRLKVSVPIRGGFKLIARKGKTTQEVFVLTHLSKPDLEATLQSLI